MHICDTKFSGFIVSSFIFKNSNELIVDAWMPTTWTDTRLSAAADRFRDDFSHISIPQSAVWVPDITLYQR